MIKRVAIISIFVVISILITGCTNGNQRVENLSSSAVSQEDSEINNPSSQTTEQNAPKDAPSDAEIKDCEYKAMQTVVNMFGQMEVSNYGEYDFLYFTEKGMESYNDFKEMFKDGKLLSVGKPKHIDGCYWKEKEKICTIIWFWYEGFDTRTTFDIYFIKQEDKWLIDSIELNS